MSTLRSVPPGPLPLAVILAACLLLMLTGAAWAQDTVLVSTGGLVQSLATSPAEPKPEASQIRTSLYAKIRWETLFFPGLAGIVVGIPLLSFGGRAMLIDNTCFDDIPCEKTYSTNRLGVGLSLVGTALSGAGIVLIVLGSIKLHHKIHKQP